MIDRKGIEATLRGHPVPRPPHPGRGGDGSRLRAGALPARPEAGAPAARGGLQDPRGLREPPHARGAGGRGGRGLGRQPRGRRRLRRDAAGHPREDLRADGLLAGQDPAHPGLRRGPRRRGRALRRCPRRQRGVDRAVGRAGRARVRSGRDDPRARDDRPGAGRPGPRSRHGAGAGRRRRTDRWDRGLVRRGSQDHRRRAPREPRP